VDLRRTFSEIEMETSEDNVDKLRNVLTAYTVRCPQVSYCQGMNFIAARLIKTMMFEDQISYRESRMSVKHPSFKSFYSKASIKAAGGI
jgi:hypothetical protein